MRATLAVSLALIAVFGAVSVAAAGSLAPVDDASSVDASEAVDVVDAADRPTPNESNASMGAEVSAFMQASASDANASVDEGMFAAEWNQSNATPDSLVNARANALENRLESLQRQKQQLVENKDNMSDVAYKARMSAIASRISALQQAINSTSDRAKRAGVNSSKLDTLRANAGNLTGPEVAAVARNLSVGVGGPPDGVPGRGNGPGGHDVGGANNSTTGNGQGAHGNGGANNSTTVDDPGNETVQGPTTGNGSGAGNGSDGGPGNDGGSGSDGGPGNGGGSGGDDTDGATLKAGPVDVTSSVYDDPIADR